MFFVENYCNLFCSERLNDVVAAAAVVAIVRVSKGSVSKCLAQCVSVCVCAAVTMQLLHKNTKCNCHRAFCELRANNAISWMGTK